MLQILIKYTHYKSLMLCQKLNIKISLGKTKGMQKILLSLTTKRNSQICSINKLTSKELYLILVQANAIKLTAKDFFENLFQTFQLN